MRRVLAAVSLLAVLWLTAAAKEGEPAVTDPRLAKLRASVNPEFPAWAPDYVVSRCAEFLAKYKADLHADLVRRGATPEAAVEKVEYETAFMQFYDFSGVPRARLPEQLATFFVAVNSASSAPAVYKPQQVTNSDQRLWWVDLRWLCWTRGAVENVSKEDPYFREPIVESKNPGLALLKATAHGNPIIRGDWFNFYVMDTSQFLQNDQTQADNAFYYQLLYATNVVERCKTIEKKVAKKRPYKTKDGKTKYKQVTETKKVECTVKVAAVPQNEQEFLDFWGVDKKVIRKVSADTAGVVDEGESGVAFQNRVVVSFPGANWLYQTFDVFRSVGNQDFLESLPIPPKEYDASELILITAKGSQIYFLTNGNRGGKKRLEFGDPRVVHDVVSGGRSVLVTFKSCLHCHDTGILPFRNEIPIAIKSGADLKAKDPFEAQNIRGFYLASFNNRIRYAQEEYAEFLRNSNGLTGVENALQVQKARNWYAGPLSLAQAAREIGVTVQEFSDAVSIGTKGRIGRLLTDGKAIPRSVWEFGGYAESALLVREYRKSANADRAKRRLPPIKP